MIIRPGAAPTWPTTAFQRGLLTRPQCFAARWTEPELRRLVRPHGPWVVVRRGVYADADHWRGLDASQRRRLEDLAAHLAMQVEHVMSHDSAARAHGIPLLRPRHELAHVTRQGVRGGRTDAGVKHHLTQFPLPDAVVLDGLPVSSLARTAVDVAREHGRDAGVGAADHALRQGVSPLRLERELRVMRCWPHVTRARAAVALADAGAENLAESLARLLLVDLGFQKIDTQWPVLAGGRVRWVDLRVGCHVVEVDGLLKYLPPEDGGIADRPARDVLREERARQQAVCAEGLGMSRVGWDDLVGRGRERAMERIAREHAVTVSRFGPELPAYLVEQAARIRARLGWRRGA